MKKPILWTFAFLLVVLVSVIWHFPASWLLSQPEVKQNLPKTVQLEQASGTWWQGQANIAFKNKSLGRLSWQWQPLDLFKAQLGLELFLTLDRGKIQGQLLTDGNQLTVENLIANVPVAFFADFAPQMALLKGAKGEIFMKNVDAIVDIKKQWPDSVAGTIALVDFEAMGMTIPQVEIKPQVQNNQILLPVNGGGKGWKLSGQTTLIAPNQFKHNLNLKSQNEDLMPDWAGLMMRSVSDTEARLKAQGRF